ncbi:MAG: polymerase, sigma-24 subunit, subfamily [Frankiales bacterium]|nr:polymerase, sigma-24 subunit, subfamily [Frankiales bacterium]
MEPLTHTSGGQPSFADLFAAHFRSMVQLARLLGADDPEDIAQESFARLHVRGRSMRDPDAALAYVRSIVCNLSRSRHRHLAVARRNAPKLLSVGGATPEQVLIDADTSDQLLVALRRLPPRQREVLVLRYWSELSEAQIAETLGISKGSVKSHASRGIDALETAMKESS